MSNARNNFFLITPPVFSKNKKKVDFINRTLERMGFAHRLTKVFDPMAEMNTIEHRINYYHLLTFLIENEVEGDLIELGSFTGQCATLFQQILDVNKSSKSVHLFDSFEKKFGIDADIETVLKKNFESKGLKQPVIHKGLFNQTIPAELPASIAFVHIDCGWGGDPEEHKQIVLYCLQNIYERISKGGICVMMDYHDPAITFTGLDCNPGVKMACDIFLKDKPEKMTCLYANEASHGYFTKL